MKATIEIVDTAAVNYLTFFMCSSRTGMNFIGQHMHSNLTPRYQKSMKSVAYSTNAQM